MSWKILNCFTNHEKPLLSYLIIIVRLLLRLNTNQFTEKVSKYLLLSTCLIRQIIHSLYRGKGITKKVYNNIINLIKLWNRKNSIFINSESSKTSHPHRLFLSLSDNMNLKRCDEYVALSNLRIYYTWKNIIKVIPK